jgi:DNA-binding NarL/FixJ family response regulator
LVVGEAKNAAEALVAVESFRPDVMLLDVRLPDMNGIELCAAIKALPKAPAILLLTSFADNELVLSAMQAGADGYLLKENDQAAIVKAVRSVLAGGAVFDPVMTRQALTQIRQPKTSLSSQERRVLAAVAAGKTDKEVAVALGLSPKTVRNYLDRVFEKLGVRTRTEAAVAWLRVQGTI